MLINEFFYEIIEEFCGVLERVFILNWKMLMKLRFFFLIYKEEDEVLIGNSVVLIDDMIY